MFNHREGYAKYINKVSSMTVSLNTLYNLLYTSIINSEYYYRSMLFGFVKDKNIKLEDFSECPELKSIGVYSIEYNREQSYVKTYFYPTILTLDYDYVYNTIQSLIDRYKTEDVIKFNSASSSVDYNLCDCEKEYDFMLWTLFGRYWVDYDFRFKNVPKVVYLLDWMTDGIAIHNYQYLYENLGTEIVRVFSYFNGYEIIETMDASWKYNVSFYIRDFCEYEILVKKLLYILSKNILTLKFEGSVKLYFEGLYHKELVDESLLESLENQLHIELYDCNKIYGDRDGL